MNIERKASKTPAISGPGRTRAPVRTESTDIEMLKVRNIVLLFKTGYSLIDTAARPYTLISVVRPAYDKDTGTDH